MQADIIEKYSGVVAVGGDGTVHEVVNGIMGREDKKKIPIGIVPNGTGNDTCAGINIDTIEEALIYLQKGETVKVDVLKVMIDVQNEQEIT